MFDLLICMRCHDYLPLILDTARSVKYYTGVDTSRLIFAVDCNPLLAAQLEKRFPGQVYCSGVKYGWGAGLYTLLVESLLWAEERWKFEHFLSIDYDTLFVGEDVDIGLLEHIESEQVGMVGHYRGGHPHWANVYKREKGILEKSFGHIPRAYLPGEGVQGGCMLLTRMFIEALRERRFLAMPLREVKKYTGIADDHLLPLLMRVCRLSPMSATDMLLSEWNLSRDPRGLEKEGIKVFHPTKCFARHAGSELEVHVRTYFAERQKETAPFVFGK